MCAAGPSVPLLVAQDKGANIGSCKESAFCEFWPQLRETDSHSLLCNAAPLSAANLLTCTQRESGRAVGAPPHEYACKMPSDSWMCGREHAAAVDRLNMCVCARVCVHVMRAALIQNKDELC